MAIVASVSAQELSAQVNARFVNKYVEAALINAPGIQYTPGTTVDATFAAFEVAAGTGGYKRQVFSYAPADLTGYADEGVALATKATVFPHDGSATAIDFTHAVLLWGDGNVVSLDAPSVDPSAGVDGIYTDLPTTTTGSGSGLTVDLAVNNNIFVFTPSQYGRGYAAADTVTVLEATMEAAGAISAGAGQADMDIANVSDNLEAGQIISVAAPTSAVVLDSGNEAAFYWDVKLFGLN